MILCGTFQQCLALKKFSSRTPLERTPEEPFCQGCNYLASYVSAPQYAF